MRKLYLDIDGVILTKKQKRKADNLEEFVEFILKSFECYWLTTHCKGDNKNTLNYLTQFLDNTLIDKLRTIKPTMWTTLKIEAIEMSDDFIWLEDDPLQSEIEKLNQAGKLNNLILVNLDNTNELLRIRNAFC